MKTSNYLIFGIALVASPLLAQDYQVPRTEWGVPDLQAVWKHPSIIPVERPRDLGEKRFYPDQEALDLVRA